MDHSDSRDDRDAIEGAQDATEAAQAAAEAAPAPGIDWDALEARLAAASRVSLTPADAGAAAPDSSQALPSYRRIWFASLIRQGREAESTGRAALAAHCRARLEQEFAAFGIASDIPAGISPSVASTEAGGAAGSESPERVGNPDSRRAPGETAFGSLDASVASAPRGPSPLEALAARRDAAARARLRELLDRHAARLSPDEAAAFAQALAASAEAGAKPAAGGAPAASIADLRRRLVDRLMRAARYRRHAARLAAWSPAPPSGVAGPYNDYRALEDLLHRVAVANPHAAEWAAEFFDIYAEMRAVRQAYGTLLPGK